MPRPPKPTDFIVPVEGVGQFTFGQRAMRDEIAIQVEYAKLIDGAPATEWLQAVCGWIATLKVLTVRAPDDWNVEELDPLDPETYAKLNNVHGGLVEHERSFRRNKGTSGT